MNITRRQRKIFEYIRKSEGVSRSDISGFLRKELQEEFSHMTIVRDLEVLLEQELIVKKGKGRAVRYQENVFNEGLRFIDVEHYFSLPPDERTLPVQTFSNTVFALFEKPVFSEDELQKLDALNEQYVKRFSALTPAQMKREFERLTIEFSWKSSHIEGNTYSMPETETLIKEHKEAEGHTKEEAKMILNHKYALEYIRDRKSEFQNITVGKIENIHALAVEGLGVEKGLRKKPVRITGTKYLPMDNPYHIREAMDRLADLLASIKNPYARSLASVLLVSYIQPFEDGNKRTARLLGNAVLMAGNTCPISYRSASDTEYKKAVLLFYEQNNFRYFREIFLEQFEFAVENYFI